MKLLLIVTIVLALQPTKPEDSQRASQGKTTQSAKQSNGTNNNRDESHAPSVSVTINNAPATPNPKPYEDESNENMRIQSRLALYTGLLVFVGLVTAGVLIWQSVETHRAANAAHEAAEAALQNTRVMINSERPWVMIQVKEVRMESTEHNHANLFGKGGFQLMMFNYGNTPAHILDCKKLRFEALESPDKELPLPPHYEASDWNKRFLAPHDSLPIDSAFHPHTARLGIVAERYEQGKHTKGELVVYGLIEYSDGVSRDAFRTAFCYRHDHTPTSITGDLVPCGPREYNDYS
jgi:hypothetical protein